MSAFTGEEKVDLLLKKVAYGVSKTGTSETKGPDGEPLTSFTAVQPGHVWKEANGTNVPFNNPTSGSTSYVGVYAKGGSDSDFNTAGNVQAPKLCTAISTAAFMPGTVSGSNGFSRAWDTGVNNWLGPSFGGNYAVKVYVGGNSWDGQNSTMVANGVQEIIFGAEPSADWFFDYEAGVIYWTNEEGTDTGTSSYDQSTAFTNTSSLIGTTDVVYVAGYVYLGATGVGSDVSIDQTDTADAATTYYPLLTSVDGTSAGIDLYQDGDITFTGNTNILTAPTINASTGFNGVIGGTTPYAGTFESVTVDLLQIDNNAITTASGNQSITITPHGTGTITLDANTLVEGSLTVSGDLIQANGVNVEYEDTILTLGVPRNDSDETVTNMDVTADTGFNFTQLTAGGAVTEFAAMRYDNNVDVFKFTRWTTLDGLLDGNENGGAANGSWDEADVISYADNLEALRFVRTHTITQTDQDGTSGTQTDPANAEALTRLGGVARCRIELTSESGTGGDGAANYADIAKLSNGYPITHKLDSKQVYCIAFKIQNASSGDPSGVDLGATTDSQNIFIKYHHIDADNTRVFLPSNAAAGEIYEIVVVG